MRPRRFSYVCADAGIPVPGLKGASLHVEAVCRTLTRLGWSGEVLSARATAETIAGLPLRDLDSARPSRRSRKQRNGGPAAAEARATEIDADCGFVYERYSLWHTEGLRAARARGVPFILEVNSPLPEEAARYRRLDDGERAWAVARQLMSEADGIVCVSEEVADWVADLRGHDREVWVVPNGVDEELFDATRTGRQRRWPAGDDPLIAFAGSFRPWHGTDDLLAAFAQVVRERVPRAHLLCVGDGPRREAFEREAKALGLADRVHVTGQVPHAEVPQWLAGADVAVAPYPALPSFYFSPLKVFEFLALGLPTVATDVGQLSQLLDHPQRGWLYPAGRTDLLAERLADILENPQEAAPIAAAGQDWVLENATWTRRVEGLVHRISRLPV